MRRNRQRILDASIELFNQSGAIAVTTNHIAKHLAISPGNLYFHFRNKEDIVRELFKTMAQETYQMWNVDLDLTPVEFISRSYDVSWRFRFFHREMYHLRRVDPELGRLWKRHLSRCIRLLKIHYGRWVKSGAVRSITDSGEMKMLSDSVLLFSSASLNFFESTEKPASSRNYKGGIESMTMLMWPYFSPDYKKQSALMRG